MVYCMPNQARAYCHTFINLNRLLYAQNSFSAPQIILNFTKLILTTCQTLCALELNIISHLIEFLSLNDSKLLLELCLNNKKKDVSTSEQEYICQSINQLCGTTLLFKVTNFSKQIFIYKILYSGRFSPVSWKRSLAAISPIKLIISEKFGSKQPMEQLSNFLLKLVNTYFKQTMPQELVNYFSEFLSINDCHALFRAQYAKRSYNIETSEIKEIEAHTETTCSHRRLYQTYSGILLKY